MLSMRDGSTGSRFSEDKTATSEDELVREHLVLVHYAVADMANRLPKVVVGYFFEERSMADLGAELGVSESRISQMRAEALSFLKDGMTSQLEDDETPAAPTGRTSRRRQAYKSAVASQSTYASRL